MYICIIEQNWEHVCNENKINSAYDKFIKTFISLYDKNCPLKRICIDKNRNRHQWFTNGLRNACHKKNKLYKDFLKKRTHESESKYKNCNKKSTTCGCKQLVCICIQYAL